MSLKISKGLVFRNGYIGTDDPDAEAYIAAVEAADLAADPTAEPLETATKVAIHSFFKGCKNDGIWPAIKASCILAGARTLNGALVPLAGTAPTNFNFVDGDYNRKTGLVGDGSTKYLDSNRNNNADPQDSQHLSVFASTALADASRYIGSGASAGSSTLGLAASSLGFRSRNSDNFNTARAMTNGFIGISRSNGTTVNSRISGSTVSHSQTSNSPADETIEVFRGVVSPTASRFAFYSIGESLDLALLDARVTDLINAFGAAIP